MKSRHVRTVLFSAGLLVIVAARGVLVPAGVRLHTRDVNRDGRPDVWEYYDSRGALLRASIDTNFDGRWDVQESYQEGRLVRRETDRNFDDQIDQTEEFDPATGEHTRSVVDVDFDGRADLLVLFADGRPVHEEWARVESWQALAAPSSSAPERRGDQALRTFEDPFSTATRLRSALQAATSVATWADSRSLPVTPAAPPTVHQVPGLAPWRLTSCISCSPISPFPPRGPPAPNVPL